MEIVGEPVEPVVVVVQPAVDPGPVRMLLQAQGLLTLALQFIPMGEDRLRGDIHSVIHYRVD